jgi:hypothetical protein
MNLYPSILAHFLNGFFLFLSIILFLFHFLKIKKMEPYKIILLTVLFSIAIGVHSLSHLGLEIYYGYNPLELFFEKLKY